MIQRIQSVWLFLAAMFSGLLFIMKLYFVETPTLFGLTEQHNGVRDSGHLALFILAAVITLLPLLTIFFYQNRQRQRGMVWISIIGCVAFIALAVMKIAKVESMKPGQQVSYDFGLLMPVAAIIFLVLALAGIRKDDKLIKSLDRLR